jgi:hypothetical protein
MKGDDQECEDETDGCEFDDLESFAEAIASWTVRASVEFGRMSVGSAFWRAHVFLLELRGWGWWRESVIVTVVRRGPVEVRWWGRVVAFSTMGRVVGRAVKVRRWRHVVTFSTMRRTIEFGWWRHGVTFPTVRLVIVRWLTMMRRFPMVRWLAMVRRRRISTDW